MNMNKEASLDAIRKKQYWQMLKRLYGGTEQTVKRLSKSRDFNIYHGTSKTNVDKILEHGLKMSKRKLPGADYGQGVYFGSKLVAGSHRADATLLRLKRPSELAGEKDVYPKITKAMRAEMKFNPRTGDKEVLKAHVYKSDTPFKHKVPPTEQILLRSDIDNKLIKKAATIKGKKRACSLKQDKKGWYVATHRARSDSYKSPEAIPEKDIKFIESTGGDVVEGIEKLALNAMKAREAARKVGLLPEGQWKWALRQLKGKSGKELSDAKKKLGSMPNNTKQVAEAMQRKITNKNELSIDDHKFMKSKPKSSSINRILGDKIMYEGGVHPRKYFQKDNVRFRINKDPKTPVGTVPLNIENYMKSTMHTHPVYPKNLPERTIGAHSHRNSDFSGSDWLKKSSAKLKNKEQRKHDMRSWIATAHEDKLPSSDFNTILKDVLVNRPKNAKGIKDLHYDKKNHVIYSPHSKIEGVHKVRPEGVRSIYLDRTPRKALEKKAKAPRPKTYAVDFDGTIVTNAYPRIGKPKKETIDFMKKVHARGDRVIVWTSRGGKPLDYMQKFLDKNQIPYHEINSNNKFKTGSPKIIADHYIDDKAVHVDDLHKLAKIGAFMEKIAALPGAVHRTMSGLINKKLTTVAPIVPKTATFTRPSSMTGGGTKKIAEGGTFMDLLEKLAAGFKTKRTKDYDAQTRGKRPQPEKQFRKPTPKASAQKVETAAKSGVGSLLENVKKGAGGVKDAIKGVGAKLGTELGTKGKIGLAVGGVAGGIGGAYGANKAWKERQASDYIEEQFEKLAGTAWKKYLIKSEGAGKSIADRVKDIKPTVMKDMGIQKIPGVEYNVDEIAKGKVRGDIAKNRSKILNAMG